MYSNYKEVVLVARVSHEDQIDALPAQKRRLMEFAKSKKFNYKYFEFHESAYKGDRKSFREIIDYVLNVKGFCALVFDKVDRFSRNIDNDVAREVRALVDLGRIELVFVSESLVVNKNSPAPEKFRLGLSEVLASYYSNATSDNVKRRFEQLREAGHWPHKAPIGYVNIRTIKGTTIEHDGVWSNIIPKLFSLRAEGKSYGYIAHFLKQQRVTMPASFKPVSRAHVERILANPFYYGDMRINGDIYAHIYKPLVSKKLFMTVQKINSDRSTERSKKIATIYAFKGIARCGKCNRSMSSYAKKGHVYLRCSGTGVDRCGNPNVAETHLISPIMMLLERLKFKESDIIDSIPELKRLHNNEQRYYQSRISEIKRSLSMKRAGIEKCYEDYVSGSITPEIYAKTDKKLNGDIRSLEDSLAKIEDEADIFLINLEYLLKIVRKAADLFKSSNSEFRNALIKALFSNVTIVDKCVSYEVINPLKNIFEDEKKLYASLSVTSGGGGEIRTPASGLPELTI